MFGCMMISPGALTNAAHDCFVIAFGIDPGAFFEDALIVRLGHFDETQQINAGAVGELPGVFLLVQKDPYQMTVAELGGPIDGHSAGDCIINAVRFFGIVKMPEYPAPPPAGVLRLQMIGLDRLVGGNRPHRLT